MVLAESEIQIPDRCKACLQLGELASTLSRAQENKQYIVTSTNEETLSASMKAQLGAQIRERFPGATDEEIASTVNNSLANFFDSDQYSEFLKSAGSALETEESTIEATLGKITTLLAECPPEGCHTSE